LSRASPTNQLELKLKTHPITTQTTEKMSRFTVRSSSRQQRTRTPFCKICKKAGKSESVYTSHFVRDKPNGKVVCPTLLSTECRYCHELGHTKAHCPKLAEKAHRQASYEKQQKANLKKRKAEDRLRAQVEASQQGKGETFLAMSFGNSTVRVPIKCHPVVKKAKKTVSVGSAFDAFCSDSDDSDDEEIAMVCGPAPAQAVKPAGVWGNGAAAIAQVATTTKPQRWNKPKRVTFQHDNAEMLMKPPASEERTYIKGSPTNEFSHKMDILQDQPMKRSANAWKPRKLRKRTTSVNSYDMALQCDEEFRPKKAQPSRLVAVIKAELKEAQEELDMQENSTSWADACDTDDLEEKIEELEEKLKRAQQGSLSAPLFTEKDQFGRPTADNSAW